MKREKAMQLAEHVLTRLDAGQSEYPFRLVNEIYVFGSFARGALEPHDVDLDVEYDHADHEWAGHVIGSLTRGRDPYVILRRALRGNSRGCQLQFNFRAESDIEMMLLWRRGDSLETALQRLHGIAPAPSAGRAERDAMLPEFEGLDDRISLACRELLSEAVGQGAIHLERLRLPDAQVADGDGLAHLTSRWKPSSPLFRAAGAVIGYFEGRGIEPALLHLHGADIVYGSTTPYFVGFQLRYFHSIPYYFTQLDGLEYVEVVHPTRSKPLDCLRLTAPDVAYFRDAAVRW